MHRSALLRTLVYDLVFRAINTIICARHSTTHRRSRGRHLYASNIHNRRRPVSHRHRRGFVPHTRVLEHVRPLPARAGVAVFEMLPEVVRAEEFLRLVAFGELVHVADVLAAALPVGWVGELLATEAADVCRAAVAVGCVERRFDVGEGSAGPGVAS